MAPGAVPGLAALAAAAGSAALAAAAGLAGLAAAERRDAPATRWSVVAVVVVVVLAALAAGRGRQRQGSRRWLRANRSAVARLWRQPDAEAIGAAVWVLLLVAVAAWDGFSFTRQQADFPTLSHYLGLVTEHAWSRGLAFFAWLVWGTWAALGWRRPQPRPRTRRPATGRPATRRPATGR